MVERAVEALCGVMLHVVETIIDVTPGKHAHDKLAVLLIVQGVGAMLSAACFMASVALHLFTIG